MTQVMEKNDMIHTGGQPSGGSGAAGGRDSSLELLRILAMLLIVASHLACHSMGDGWKMWELPFCANQAWSIALGRWGTFGVELFIILSGYFMCGRKGIHSRKLFELAFQTVTTCVVFFFFIRLTGLNMVGKKALLEEVLELFTSQNYWFIPAYMVFYALIPFLQLVSNRRGASFRIVVVYTLLSLVFRFYRPWWTPFFGRVGHFAYLYFITAWLKEAEGHAEQRGARDRKRDSGAEGSLYGVRDRKPGRKQEHFIARHAGLLSLACFILLVFEACFSRWRVTNGRSPFTLYIGTWLTLLFEFSLFYFFKNLRIGKSRFINAAAGTVFGVYLLHENFLWMSWKDHERFSILWDQLLGAARWYESPFFPVYFVLAPLLVLAVCAAVEFGLAFLRRQLLSRWKRLDALCARIDGWYCAMFMAGE